MPLRGGNWVIGKKKQQTAKGEIAASAWRPSRNDGLRGGREEVAKWQSA
jgi:hypothetical protein